MSQLPNRRKAFYVCLDRWRYCFALLGTDCVHLWHDVRLCFDRRDGLNVTYGRRPVPLGLRICTSWYTKIPKLSRWSVTKK